MVDPRGLHSELGFMPISSLARLLHKRQISAVELTTAFLARIEALAPSFNAVAFVAREAALDQARRADEKLKQRGDIHPLCGIPYGVKDLVATNGIPTQWGSPAFTDQVFDFNATVVDRLERAGAVLVAKLAMVELAGAGGYAYPSASATGPCLNPWSRDHWAGGSSSGSGAAVAAGLVPFALGSETGGSIVIPSSFCGITGLRPTFGAVSRFGVMPLSWSMDKIGPMARDARGCEGVLAVLAGRDESDPTTVSTVFRRSRRSRFRIGILPSDFSDFADTGSAFEEALRVLGKLGADLKDVDVPDHDYSGIYEAVLAAETAASHEAFIRGPGINLVVDDSQKAGLQACLTFSAASYARAMERRVAVKRDVDGIFEDVDLLVCPTVLTEAIDIRTDLTQWRIREGLRVGETASTRDAELPFGFGRRGHYAKLGALAGLPGLTVPMGFGARGLPLGISIIGRDFAEATMLRLASMFQDDTDWHLRRPLLEVAAG